MIRNRRILQTALAASALALVLIFTSNASAGYIFDLEKICTIGDDCAGNPESDIYKVTITENDDYDVDFFTIDWLVPAETSSAPVDLAASSTWTIISFDSDKLVIKIDISNDTDLTGYPDANNNILSFGFGVDPDSEAELTVPGTVFTGVGEGGSNGNGNGNGNNQQEFPGGFKQIDVCVIASNNCNGGGINGGLEAGDSDTLQLAITPTNGGSYANNDGSSIDLLFFPLKFQGTWGSYQPAGFPDNGNGDDPRDDPPGEIPVPEPATIGLLGIGLLGLGVASFRRRRIPPTINAAFGSG